MKPKILEILKDIEVMEGIKILFAAEVGSRTWGIASPDSDWDVRFVYVRPLKYYLSLQGGRDCIDNHTNTKIDITGWDVRKALQCIYKSNASIFEWMHSPTIYVTSDAWSEIIEVASQYFSNKKAMHHYYNLSRKTYYTNLIGEPVQYKKYVYALYPILACKWILEKNTQPPLSFSILAKSVSEKNVQHAMQDLISTKQLMSSRDTGKRIDTLDSYITETLFQLEKTVKLMTEKKHIDWEPLNQYFCSLFFDNHECISNVYQFEMLQEAKQFIYPRKDQEPYRCPSCHADLGFTDDYYGDLETTHFCKNCGQDLCK